MLYVCIIYYIISIIKLTYKCVMMVYLKYFPFALKNIFLIDSTIIQNTKIFNSVSPLQ